MIRKLIIGACAAALLIGGASAGPLASNGLDSDDETWFYNRPGVSYDDHMNDRQACANFGLAMAPEPTPSQYTYYDPQYGLGGILGAAIGEAIGAAVVEGMNRGPRAAYTDDCMIARGYRRYTVDAPDFQTFSDRFNTMMPAEWRSFASADTPAEGVLARMWANSYWLPQDGDAPASTEIRVATASTGVGFGRREFNPLRANAAIEPGPNDAIAVVSLRMTEFGSGTLRFTWERDSEGVQGSGVQIEGRRRPVWPMFEPSINSGGGGAERQLIFVVPAGTYALASAQVSGRATQFCLGTPSVELSAGSVTYLGSVLLSPDEHRASEAAPPAPFAFHIDTRSLDAGRAILAAHPQLAERLEMAEYRNGYARTCETGRGPVYGVDVPGAPWAPPDESFLKAGMTRTPETEAAPPEPATN